MPMKAKDPELLKKVYLFHDLSPKELELILSIGFEKIYEKESFIFKEGELGDAFYIVLEGAVRISTVIPGVGEEALKILREGEYFGEMALIDDFPRSASAIAHEGSAKLLAIYKRDFKRLLSEDRELAYKLLTVFVKTLSARLRETDERLKSIFAIAKTF
ncbi:MAG: cyclic nucleotide-binding domain-containing protein [Candidatus Edwardsbacteria bacterium]